jgi:predicted naringenin-chalcone synthase
MSPRAYLTVRPLAFGHSVPQVEGVAWMKAALERGAEEAGLTPAEVARALRYYGLLDRATPILSRTTTLDDYVHTDWERMQLWREVDGRPWFDVALERRTAVFSETALALARQAFQADPEAPDLLVQVSCTGYDSPTALQRVAVEKGWTSDCRVLHIGHMGCYAALPAVATAADVVAARPARAHAIAGNGDPESVRAAIMLVELCTLHLRPTTIDTEQIVQQALFADGAARIDVTSTPPGRGFALIDHAEVIAPDSLDAMTWRVADGAFQMTLARSVPDVLRTALPAAVESLLSPHGLAVQDVQHWAVHPGGPRIIEAAAETLSLPEDAVRHSQAVLATRGNMSSATLPHIWASMADDPGIRAGELVVSLAFGPGLTVAMNLMTVEG